jgi:uncharacterized protein with NRDE domain
MCLLIFAHQTTTRYPLVVAANRDEFHARPTAASQFWTDHPGLLAGQDLDQGGTWMGVTRDGRFAAITNYRDPSRTAAAPRSRGELPLDYLTGQRDPQTYLQDITALAPEYAGFNLLLGDRDHLWYLTNSLPAAQCVPLCLPPGIYGLSNARLDTLWPKVDLGKTRLKNLLDRERPSHDALASVVGDQRLADLHELRPHGMETEMDQVLSAQFIVTGSYGTRSSTTLWTDNTGLAHWRELSFNELGEVKAVKEFEFALV